MNIYVAIDDHKGRFMARFIKEQHVGRIPPFDDMEVMPINGELNGKYDKNRVAENYHKVLLQCPTVRSFL